MPIKADALCWTAGYRSITKYNSSLIYVSEAFKRVVLLMRGDLRAHINRVVFVEVVDIVISFEFAHQEYNVTFLRVLYERRSQLACSLTQMVVRRCYQIE
jgi:hypothetical protein